MMSKFKSFLRWIITALIITTSVLSAATGGIPFTSPARSAIPVAEASTPPPVVSLLSGGGSVFLGGNFSFVLRFDNTSLTETGYGPFMDVILPYNQSTPDPGGDINPANDGVNFVSAQTTFGQPVNVIQLTFPGTPGTFPSTVNHPYLVDSNNQPVVITGTAGEKLIVIQLPFGSFTPDQPPTDIQITAQVSTLADVGQPLNIRYRGGYMFGSTPLNDWCCDPYIITHPDNSTGGWPNFNVTPEIITLTKTYNGPEGETATGPNFPRTFTLQANFATGITVTGFILSDTLPNNMQFITVTAATPACGVGSVFPSTSVPGGVLRCNMGTVSGGSATLTFSFFGPLTDTLGVRVIDPVTGDDVLVTNTVSASGLPVTQDISDTVNAVVIPGVCPNCAPVTYKSIAIQKGVSNISDTINSPGDLMQYTLDFQVSDYFALNNIILTDTLGDGVRFFPGFAPTLQLNGNTFTLTAAALNAANFDVVCNYTTGIPGAGDGTECESFDPAPNDGTTRLVFRVSDELVTRGRPNGNVLGGCVNPTTGATAYFCTGYNDGPTTGRITYRAIVQDQFADVFPSGDRSVDHGDIISNSVLVGGNILSNTVGFPPTGQTETDGSGAAFSIPFGSLTKSIYAVGGNTTFSTPVEVAPGVTVTYRIRYELPTSDYEDLLLTDTLPLPIFLASEFVNLTPFAGPGLPPGGRWGFGPADTFSTFFPTHTITVSTNITSNQVMWNYGTLDDPLNRDSVIDILLTVTASDQPFADRLFLTNQVRTGEGTTNSGPATFDSLIQVVRAEPILRLTKSAVSSSNPNAIFVPPLTSTVVFDPPFTVGQPTWNIPVAGASPRISSTFLSNIPMPLNSDVTGVQAGDLVRFVLIIENSGTSPNGAFDIAISDTLPTGFQFPAGGINLQVYLGDGTGPINFTSVTSTTVLTDPLGIANTFFGAGIRLVDNPTTGICQAFSHTNGQNVVVIVYDLQVSTDAVPGVPIINRGRLGEYSGTEGGPNYVTSPLSDTATTTPGLPGLVKTLVNTQLQDPTNALTQVVIGEVLTYSIAVTIPGGTLSNTQIVDTLDAGLAFVQVLTYTASPSVTIPNPAGVLTPAVSGDGRTVTFSPGNILNANLEYSTTETLVITYQATALNVTANLTGTLLNNSAQLFWATLSLTPVSASNVTVIEPRVQITKTVTPLTGDANNVFTYTLNVVNPTGNSTTAYDMVLTDIVPSLLTYVTGTFTSTAGLAPAVLTDSTAPLLSAYWPTFTPGQTATLQFQATLNYAISPTTRVTNTAVVYWTSLPGTITNTSAFTTTDGERTGSGGINNYIFTTTVPITANNVAASKRVITTSENSTDMVLVSGGRVRVAIGEIVRTRVVITVPEGTSTGFQFRDELPNGVLFLNDNTAMVALVSNGGLTSSLVTTASHPTCNTGLLVPGSSPVAPTCVLTDAAVSSAQLTNQDNYAEGTDVYFKFGTLFNGDDDADAELIVIEFNVLVLNVAGNNGTTNRDNAFTIFISNTQTIITGTAIPWIRPVVPAITLSKSATPTSGDAGDLITYTLRYTNANNANNNTTAFDVVLTDIVPAQLTLLPPITVSVPATTETNGNTLTATVASVPLGGNVIITYVAQLNATVPPFFTITNTARLTYTTLPGITGTAPNPTGSVVTGTTGITEGERLLTTTTSLPITTFAPGLTKQIVSTSLTNTTGNNVMVGEVITYRATLSVPEGVMSAPGGVTLRDTLGAGLAFVACTGISASGALTTSLVGGFASACADPTNPTVNPAGSVFTFTLGTITNTNSNNAVSETIDITFTAVALNVLGNQDGTTLPNSINVTWNNGVTRTITGTAPNATVREPVFSILKQADPLDVDANDTVTFTLRLTNTSAYDAFDVVLTDVVPGAFTYVPGSLAVAAGLPATSLLEAAPALTATWNLFPAGQSATLTFTAVLSDSAGPGDVITNTIIAQWTSLPGVVTTTTPYTSTGGERTGDGGLNDYIITTTRPLSVTGEGFAKFLEGTSAAHTANPDVTIGEVLTYALPVTLPEGLTPSLVITDLLPSGLAYVTGSVQVDTTGFAGIVNTSPSVTIGGDGNDVIMAFGPVTVTSNNNPADNTFVVRIQVTVLDVPTNTNGTVFTNSAVLQAGSLINSANVTNTVVEPVMAITKTIVPAYAAAGETFTVTLVVHNSGLSTAFDVRVRDALPNTYITNVTPISTYPGFTYNSFIFPLTTEVVYLGGNLVPGETAVFTFTAQATNQVTAGQLFINEAVITNATTLPGGGRNEGPITGTAPITFTAPDLTIVKTGPLTATAGTTFVYTLTVSNVGGLTSTTAANVTVSDALPGYPANLTFVSADPAPASGPNPLTWNLGAFAPGASQTIRITVTVPATSTFTPLVNTAVVSTTTTEPITSNNTSTITTVVTTNTDVLVYKEATPTPVNAGDILTYFIGITNLGPSAAQNVVLTDVLPLSVTLQTVTPATATQSGNQIGWNFGTLLPNETRRVTVTVLVNPALTTPIANTALITTTTPETTTTNNTSTVTTPVTIQTDLEVTKYGPTDVTAGVPFTYALVVTNTGPAQATSVSLTDTLPAGATFVSAFPAQTSGPNPLVWDLGTLNAGEARTLIVTVTTSPVFSGTLFNSVVVGTPVTETVPITNNTSGVTTTVVSTLTVTSLDIYKEASPTPVEVGSILTYFIGLTNTGPAQANNVVLTDIMPLSVTLQTVTPATATQSGNQLGWVFGNLLPGEARRVTITVLVDPALTTPIVNTALVTTTSPISGGNYTSTVSTPVAYADLLISKRVSPAQLAAVGQFLTYTIVLTNNGPNIAAPVTMNDPLPSPLVFRNLVAPAGWTCVTPLFNTNGTVTCDTPQVNVGEVFTFTLLTRVITYSEGITNTAYVASPSDGNPTNNTSATPVFYPTAVDLLYFRVENVTASAITLGWGTAAEINTVGYRILRAPTNNASQAEVVGYQPAAPMGTYGAMYTYVDTPPSSGPWWYWLEDVDTGGQAQRHGPVSAQFAQVLQWRVYLPVLLR